MKERDFTSAGNAAVDDILSRWSVRKFDGSRPVDDKDVETVLRAAMAAPSGVNRQPWAFSVVTEGSLLSRLGDVSPYCRYVAEAPLAIVVFGDRERMLPGEDAALCELDLSAATENILLAAHALGLGGTWCAVYPNRDRMRKLADIMHAPDSLMPFAIIPLGYPGEKRHYIDKWDPSRVFHNAFTSR